MIISISETKKYTLNKYLQWRQCVKLKILPFWKFPSFPWISGCCYGSFVHFCDWWISWVNLVWLAASTVRLQVSSYSQLSDYNCTEWFVKNEAANASIIMFVEFVMVIIIFVFTRRTWFHKLANHVQKLDDWYGHFPRASVVCFHRV